MSEGPADDPFSPPDEPCEVWCLHCRRVYDSSLIRWVAYETNKGSVGGFWVCPVPDCDGKGFTFDIFPVDPAHPANEGWSDDSEGEEDEDEEGLDNDDDIDPSEDLVTSEVIDSELNDESFDSETFDDDDEPEGEFKPHSDWTPQHDLSVTDPDQYMEDGSPRRFTLEEFQKAISEGIYEREDAILRQRMKEPDRGPSDRGSSDFRDEDIPF